MLPGMSDERLNYQWKIDEIILDALEGLDLSDQEARAEFERIRILDELEESEGEDPEGEDPDDGEFEPLQYIATHEDLIEAFGADEAAGERHWLTVGQAEGREADDFDEEQYLANYPDLQAAFGDDTDAATRHYIEFGFDEERNTEGSDEGGPDGEEPDEGGSEDEPLAGAASSESVPIRAAAEQDFLR